jgi:hypothetical protein
MVVRRFGMIVVLAVAACAPPPSPGNRAAPAAPAGVALRQAPPDPAKPGSKTVEVPMLLGLASREIEELFGMPRFVRRDGPAQIWQYGTDACTVSLFFYRDGPQLKVRHVEFRNRSADMATPGGCEGAIVSMAQPATR